MGKIEFIPFKEKDKWNRIVQSFSIHDVYYLNEYVSAFRYTKDGEPHLISFSGNKMRLCYVVQQSDLAESTLFRSQLKPATYYDWSTPYGYGGPLTESFDLQEMGVFFNLLHDYCRSENIVSQFLRFHPLIQNQKMFEGFCELKRLKSTVFIKTEDLEIIASNMDPKNRNMVKKAEKNGIEIIMDNSKEARSKFVDLYKGTMQRNNATEYYYFTDQFFDDMFLNLEEHFTMFHAVHEKKIISSAIILHKNNNLHYHLSASNREFMHLAPNNLLLYTVASWGAKSGYKRFHLGGGIGIEDSLLSFKKSFNMKGLIDFYIGRNVFCNEIYNQLIAIRSSTDINFNPSNNHLIQYRA